jgi:Protein of unknown function (DUF2934).
MNPPQSVHPNATASQGNSGGGENAPASPDLRERPLHEEIAACARELWRKYGCPVGRDEQIWLEAERQLLGSDSRIARVGGAPGSTAADTVNQAAPAPTAGPGFAPGKRSGERNGARVAPGPAGRHAA